jgi:hypothetical protein
LIAASKTGPAGESSTYGGIAHPLLVYAVIILIAVFLRTLFTSYIELAGDALHHWQFAKVMSENFDLSLFSENHHRMRWATNIWPILYAWIFGWGYGVYYVVPMIFFGFLLISSAVFIRKIKSGFFPFILFVVVFLGEPMFYRSTSHLLTFVFAAVFMMSAAIFLVRAIRIGGQMAYVLTATTLFLAYGAHESSLLFFPGVCAFVLWNAGFRRGLLILVNIGAYGLALIALETLFFDLVSPTPVVFGRFELLGHALDIVKSAAQLRYHVSSILDLMRPWLQLPLTTGILVILGIVGGVYLAGRERIGQEPSGSSLPFFLMVSFFLFQAFLIQSFDPLVPFSPPNVKYLANTTIWATLSTVFAAVSLVDNRRGPTARDVLRNRLMGTAAVLTVLAVVFDHYRGLPSLQAWFWRAGESYEPMETAIKEGAPILSTPEMVMEGYFEDWFSTPLSRVTHPADNEYFAFAVDPAAARKSPFCVDLRSSGNQAGRWLIRCPADLAEAVDGERQSQ